MNEAAFNGGHYGRRAGFTIVELFIVLAVVAVLLALFLPAVMRSRQPAARINCVNHLKQSGLACKTWALDNGDKFPMGVSTNMGGAMEPSSDTYLAAQFQVMSNELSTPKILVCPNDAKRAYATNFATLKDENISYFLNVDAADDTPESLLSGDGNITNTPIAGTRIVKLSPGETVGWNQKLHQFKGNILLCDGSVGQFLNPRRSGRQVPVSTNTARLVVPPPK